MSEHTLPFQIIENTNVPVGWIVGIGDGVIVVNVRGEQMNLSFAEIRQWQASAEPAPPPSAPVVTITEDELIEIINAAHANDDESCCDGDYTDTRQRTLQAINDAIKTIQIVCPEYPALCGADLAPEPEGARDGQ